jgi:uncharacterized membrane protein
MALLIAGLIVFLGTHSLRIFAEDWRGAQVAKLGLGPYKGAYSVVSLIGLVLIVIGFGQARTAPIVLWGPPVWTRHVSALLILFAFVLLAAAYVPRNAIKAAVKHPMILGVKIWAAAHLLANGNVADVLLFGGFLVWAVFDYRAARMRDRREGTVAVATRLSATVTAIVIGALAWVAFALYLHAWLFGVQPFAV